MSKLLAVKLLEELRTAGLRLRAQGDQLLFKPKEALTPELESRIQALKAEVLALLGSEVSAEPSTESAARRIWATAPLLPASPAPGTPPTRACNACFGRAFHKVRGGPEFVCDTCHPGPGPKGWAERAEATEPSIFESMHRRGKQVERMDIRGLGKKGRRPTSWDGAQR